MPGTYREPGGTPCYWARLRSLDTSDIIDNSDGPQVVEIQLSDKAFQTRGCATRKPKRHIAAGLGHLQDVQVGVAGSRALDLHQDLTGPGFGHRDITKFARALPGQQLKRFQGCTPWGESGRNR
jgi:hypothetical protein